MVREYIQDLHNDGDRSPSIMTGNIRHHWWPNCIPKTNTEVDMIVKTGYQFLDSTNVRVGEVKWAQVNFIFEHLVGWCQIGDACVQVRRSCVGEVFQIMARDGNSLNPLQVVVLSDSMNSISSLHMRDMGADIALLARPRRKMWGIIKKHTSLDKTMMKASFHLLDVI